MSLPSLIFWLVFAIPLFGLLIWVMRQDKRRGVTGVFVVALIFIIGIVYIYVRTRGK